MADQQAGNRVVSLALRPPRFVFLFLADDSWEDWARLAIATASRYWGGGGFAYIPYSRNGDVDAKVLAAATAFDPDYVGLMTHDAETWHRLSPTAVNWGYPTEATDDQIFEYLRRIGRIDDVGGNIAAKTVIDACSPLTYGFEQEIAAHAHFVEPGPPQDRSAFIGAPRPGTPQPFGALAASGEWAGRLSLFATSRTGVAPSERVSRVQPADAELLAWIVDPAPANAPEQMLWFSEFEFSDLAQNHATWFEVASPDLSSYRVGFAPDTSALVVGDGAADFALAVLYDKLLGYAAWMPLGDVGPLFESSYALGRSLDKKLREVTGGESVPVVSASLTDHEVDDAIKVLEPKAFHFTLNEEPQTVRGTVSLVRRQPILRDGLLALGLAEHLGTSTPVPVSVHPDGSVELLAPIKSPMPTDPIPRSSFGSPAWLVDVALSPEGMPRGRGLRSSSLLGPSDQGNGYLLRSSRAGITFHSASQGFVAAGTVLASQLAAPHLEFLGLSRWIEVMALGQGIFAAPSAPGKQAAIAARLLGGRTKLIDLMSGPFFAVLAEYVGPAKSQTSTEVFPLQDGVVLNGTHRLLLIQAMMRLAPGVDWQVLRSTLDELLEARLIRQGMVLDCKECTTVSFLTLDALGQSFECQRCGSRNEMSLDRWRRMSSEPPWFYDLHPALYALVADHGDAVLRAASHIKSRSRQYVDATEMEFVKREPHVRLFEIDLITLTDLGLSVVEAKSSGSLGNGESRTKLIRKRFEAARLLKADTVIFATTSPVWLPSDVDRGNQLRQIEYPDIAVEWISNL